MWVLVGVSIVAVLVIYGIQWIIIMLTSYLKKSGKRTCLPPGSMGFPFIGETLHLMLPSYSLDLHPFITNRIRRFGPIFRTSLFGKKVVISTDPEFNNYLIQQEGRLVELWAGPISQTFLEESQSGIYDVANFINDIRSITLSHAGPHIIREKLISQFEVMFGETINKWSTQSSVEVKESTTKMAFHFFAKHYFRYDAEKLSESGRISDRLFTDYFEGLKTIPLNIPGTKFCKCLEEWKKAITVIKSIMEERRSNNNSSEKYGGDLLDQAIIDKNLSTDDQIVYTVAGIWFATCVSISSMATLIFKFFSEYPLVVEELRVEHEEILRNRDKSSSSLTWNEYKSMKFTQQVINEALRFSLLIPGLLRIAMKDIHINEYTIPAGWIILVVTPILHMNAEIYKDPLTFNPWRWKDLDSYTVSKNFKPFGGGSRQCPGAELTRAFMAIFIHVLVTKYRWKKMKGGRVVRSPILGFGDGIHIKVWKNN